MNELLPVQRTPFNSGHIHNSGQPYERNITYGLLPMNYYLCKGRQSAAGDVAASELLGRRV
jgi:hypothetical protein